MAEVSFKLYIQGAGIRRREVLNMPVIKVYGMPPTSPRDDEAQYASRLRNLLVWIKAAVATVPGLDIPAEEVSVFFPTDLLSEELGGELIAEVCGLFDKPERTDAIKKALTDAIATELADFARFNQRCLLIECYIASTIKPEALSSRKRTPPLGGLM